MFARQAAHGRQVHLHPAALPHGCGHAVHHRLHGVGDAGDGLTHRRLRQFDAAFAFDPFGLTVEWLMIEILAQGHVRHELRAKEPAGEKLGRRGRRHRRGIRLVDTDKGRPHQPQHDEPAGDALQAFDDFLTDAPVTLRRLLHGQRNDHRLLHRQIFRQKGRAHFAPLATAAFGLVRLCRRRALDGRILRFEFQIHLSRDRRRGLLAFASEDLTHQQIILPPDLRELFLQLGDALLLRRLLFGHAASIRV